MKVDQMARAQSEVLSAPRTADLPYPTAVTSMPVPMGASVYPSLGDYMGLELSEEVLSQNMPEYLQIIQYQSSVSMFSFMTWVGVDINGF